MKQGDPQVFLRHILDSIEAIERYSKSLSKEDFLKTEEKQDAILRKLEIIGEAVRHLPKDFKDQHPDVPWQEIAGD